MPCFHTRVRALEERRKTSSVEIAFRLDEMFAGGGELATLVVVPAKVTTLTSTCFARNTSAYHMRRGVCSARVRYA